MSRAFSKIVPKSDLEQERFYLDTISKLENTDSTLSDQEISTSGGSTTNGRMNEMQRVIDGLTRDVRNARLLVDVVQRQQQEIRMLRAQQPVEIDNTKLRAQIQRLEKRIYDIEVQL